MVDKQFDTDKFIELVRVRPVIWDIKNELLRLMINDFDSFSEQRKENASEYNCYKEVIT
jgi:adenine specific DNA methylase Mod